MISSKNDRTSNYIRVNNKIADIFTLQLQCFDCWLLKYNEWWMNVCLDETIGPRSSTFTCVVRSLIVTSETMSHCRTRRKGQRRTRLELHVHCTTYTQTAVHSSIRNAVLERRQSSLWVRQQGHQHIDSTLLAERTPPAAALRDAQRFTAGDVPVHWVWRWRW